MRSPCGARAAALRGLAPDAVWKLFGLAVEGTQPGPLARLSVGGTRGFNPFLALPAQLGPGDVVTLGQLGERRLLALL